MKIIFPSLKKKKKHFGFAEGGFMSFYAEINIWRKVIKIFVIILMLACSVFFPMTLIGSQAEFMSNISNSDQMRKDGRFDEALQILENIKQIDLSTNEKFELNIGKGVLNWTIGKPEKALELFKKANEYGVVSNNRKNIALSDTYIRIVSLYNEAKKRRAESEYIKAISSFREAIEISRTIGRIEFEMKCFRQMSLVCLDMNDLEEYLDYNLKALVLARKLKHRKDEGYCLNNIGIYYHKTNEYSKALDNYEAALRIAHGDLNLKAESECLTNIGVIYKLVGEYDKALSTFEKALDIDRLIGNELFMSIDLSNIGTIYRRKWIESNLIEDLKKALSSFSKCNEILPRNAQSSLKIRIAHNLGTISADMKEFSNAYVHFKYARALAEKNEDKEGLSLALNGLGNSYSNIGKEDEAIACFRKAIDLAAEIEAGQILWDAFFELASIQKKRGLFAESLQSYQYAMEVIEKGRSSIADEDLKAGFLASDRRLEVYHGALDLLYQMNKSEASSRTDDLAFQFIERAKARGFLDSLEIGRIPAVQGSDPDTERRLAEIRIRMSRLSRKLANPPGSLEERKALDQEESRLEDDYNQFRRNVRARDPRYAGLRFPEIISLEEMRKKLLDAETVVFTYAVGKETAYGMAIDRDRARLFPLPSPPDLRVLIARHLKSVSDREQPVIGTDCSLFRALLSPGLSRTYRRIIIVPDDLLHYLPFETLRAEASSSWLGAGAEVSYAPSLSSLAEIGNRAGRRKTPPLDLLAVASPDRKPETGPVLSVFRENEVEGISQLFSARKRRILKGTEAFESRLKKNRFEDFQIIHFAAHGTIDERKPVRSAIVLPDEPSSEEDGLFQVREVYDLRLNAGLVALSSCRSAGGRLLRGEGIEGINRSFLFAGASAVLMSLWPVDDEATSALMLRFYRHLVAGETISEALRKAKTEMIDSGHFSHPYFWAGFVVTGTAERRLSMGLPGWIPASFGTFVLIFAAWCVFIQSNRRRRPGREGRPPVATM